LLPFLYDKQELARETLYWHYPHYHLTKPGSVIREGEYKLIKYYEDNRLELYNLEKNIGETNNLMDALPKKAESMQKKLNLWLEKNGAGLPIPNPNYEP
jgi:arylsulfatase A-like enzyme